MKPIEVSICCPIYNEENNIQTFLDSLLRDAYELTVKWEIVLLCSGNTDNTNNILSNTYSHEKRIRIIIEKQRRGKAHAINKLKRLARGRFLIFTDSDVRWKTNSLLYLITPLQENENIGIVSGRLIPYNVDNGWLSRVNVLAFSYWHLLRKKLRAEKRLWSIPGQIYSIKRELVPILPNDTVNEDAFIGATCYLKGYLVDYSSRAKASIDFPRTLKDYFTQKVRTRIGWIQLARRNSELSPLSLIIETRKMLLKDIVSLRCPHRFDHIILFCLDTLAFLTALFLYKVIPIKSFAIWKRIRQDISG